MKEVAETPEQTPRAGELENYRRLVELQSQIVELARRNSEAERTCQLLRERLVEQTPRRSPDRLRQTLLRLLERLRYRQRLGFRDSETEVSAEPIGLAREQLY